MNVDEVEKFLFLTKFNVLFRALNQVFERDTMYWYRLEEALGRNGIVGTTVREADDIPEHLGADEKHTWIRFMLPPRLATNVFLVHP